MQTFCSELLHGLLLQTELGGSKTFLQGLPGRNIFLFLFRNLSTVSQSIFADNTLLIIGQNALALSIEMLRKIWKPDTFVYNGKKRLMMFYSILKTNLLAKKNISGLISHGFIANYEWFLI